jgi:hypothetical protein
VAGLGAATLVVIVRFHTPELQTKANLALDVCRCRLIVKSRESMGQNTQNTANSGLNSRIVYVVPSGSTLVEN